MSLLLLLVGSSVSPLDPETVPQQVTYAPDARRTYDLDARRTYEPDNREVYPL